MRSSLRSEGSSTSLAAKLAKLHTTPASVPAGYSSPQFGFSVPTCCGSTEQPNDFTSSWADFFANQRLRAIFRSSEKNNGQDPELANLVEQTATEVVPRLLGDGHLGGKQGIIPVVVHGDLWSGNHGNGSIGKAGIEEVVFDPSSCYAHSEYEFGIMKMFGGFGSQFFREYHKLKPQDEPIQEYEDRVDLYQLYVSLIFCSSLCRITAQTDRDRYHQLNHHALFGGGYRSGAVSLMKKLIRKYGAGNN